MNNQKILLHNLQVFKVQIKVFSVIKFFIQVIMNKIIFYNFCSVLEIISHWVVLSRFTNCAQYPATLTIISLCFSG